MVEVYVDIEIARPQAEYHLGERIAGHVHLQNLEERTLEIRCVRVYLVEMAVLVERQEKKAGPGVGQQIGGMFGILGAVLGSMYDSAHGHPDKIISYKEDNVTTVRVALELEDDVILNPQEERTVPFEIELPRGLGNLENSKLFLQANLQMGRRKTELGMAPDKTIAYLPVKATEGYQILSKDEPELPAVSFDDEGRRWETASTFKPKENLDLFGEATHETCPNCMKLLQDGRTPGNRCPFCFYKFED